MPDDYAANTSTSGRVFVGGASSGSIETIGDRDWFAVTLNAGTQYQLRATSTGLRDPYLTLRNGSGSFVTTDDDSGGSGNSLIIFTATSSGTYYLDVEDFGSGIGDYTVSVASLGQADDYAANTSTAGQVSVGGSSTGRIETSGDNDWFAVTLTAGTQYQMRATSTGLGDAYLTLRNSAGSAVTFDDDGGGNGNPLITFTAGSSGTYYLDVEDFGSGTGTYTVSVASLGAGDDYAANASTAGRVTVGGSSTGRIETSGDGDWFAVTLTAGTQYQLRASSTGLSDPYLTLRNSGGGFVASNDDGGGDRNALITFTASSSGTYYLDVEDYGSGTGAYTVSASSLGQGDDYSATTSTTGRVSVGGSGTGRIETGGDHDWFAVTLNAGTQYQLRASSAGLGDPLLTLRNSGGGFVTSNDDSGGGLNSLITFTASSSGTFYLDVQDYGSGTGAYTVSATSLGQADDYAANLSTAGRASVGGSSTGRIETTGDHDWFAVTLNAGTQYQLRANSAGLGDPLLTLRDGGGGFVTSNDDGGGSLNSLITYTASTSGTYYLDVQDYGSGTGNYAVSVVAIGTSPGTDDFAASTATTGRVTVGATSAGVIERSGDRDWFAVTLDAGTQYALRANQSGGNGLSDPYLTLRDGGGNSLRFDDDGGDGLNSLITFTPGTTGTYYLDVEHYGSGTGAYTVSASALSTPAPAPAGGFQITVNYSGDPAYQQAFIDAAARWAQVITQDLPDWNSPWYGQIDDLLIEAEVGDIDGVNGTLGFAGYDEVRTSGVQVPVHGNMTFDSADLAAMAADGSLTRVIMHEMGHVLGLGYFWQEIGLVARPGLFDFWNLFGTFEYAYTGANALREYRALTGNSGATSVPIESSTGSPGSDGVHWAENVFGDELMTPFATGSMALSRLSIASLQDLGYTVNYAAAEGYSLAGLGSAEAAPAIGIAPLDPAAALFV